MYQWLSNTLTHLQVSWWEVLLGVGLFVVSSVGGLAIAAFVLAKLPVDYFQEDGHPAAFAWAEQHPVLRWAALIAKNLLGVVLIIVGILLSLPGVPGPGFLTILIGILLVNFPRKRQLLRWFISRPKIRQGINDLRARFGKPPLNLNGIAPPANEEHAPPESSEPTGNSGGSRPPLASSRTPPC